jgi:hypothetical protein
VKITQTLPSNQVQDGKYWRLKFTLHLSLISLTFRMNGLWEQLAINIYFVILFIYITFC